MEKMTEFQKNLVRMWDSLRTETEYKGSHNCCPILCKKCPLNEVVCSGDGITHTIFNAEKAIEIVTQWAKKHSIATMKDKYKEVFGVEPGDYVCPQSIGFLDVACDKKRCEDCMENFWNSDYKEPKKESNA